MPLKGTPREQKHYRRIRKEYPEKGKEYAARVARNIVRANTPGGRKLKGTTEYGRTWGPPYSEPLSKQSAFYEDGHSFALMQLGIEKAAQQGLVRLLEGPYGDLLVRLPFQSAAGALGGMGVAHMTDQPLGVGAATGAATGALGGITLAAVPAVRKKFIEMASRGAV
jgi:hypothetical protein